jgi:hypothetical protein
MEEKIANLEENVEGKLEAVNTKVAGLATALIRGFNEIEDVLANMDDKIEKNPRNTPSGDRENIVVSGGSGTESVEMFNWGQRKWFPLQSMPKKRCGATSFVYNNHVTIAGGYFDESVYFDDMIKMNIDPTPDLSVHWAESRLKLPAKLVYHSSVLYNDRLILIGGFDGNATSNCVYGIRLSPPYGIELLSRMPEPRRGHCCEIFDDEIVIVGGRRTGRYSDGLCSVILYNVTKNEWKHLTPLPYEVSIMATVRWGNNIVVLGGHDKNGKRLNTVILYNVKTGQSHTLPAMGSKRLGCSAVVIGSKIVVMGGMDAQGPVKSVEAFNFRSYTWEELPEMSVARWFHTAAVV